MAEYPQIVREEWTLVGEGYNGQAYLSDAHPGVMLKLVRREMGAAHDAPDFLAFLKSWISQALETV